MTEDVAPIGLRLRELRRERGWSAQRLCDEAGGSIARSSIACLETGRNKEMSLTAALAVAKAFGITVEQLAGVDIPPAALAAVAEIASARQRLMELL